MSAVPTPESLPLVETELEDDLRRSLREMLAAHCETPAVLAVFDGDDKITHDLWPRVAVELGLAGLLVPEEFGGAGGTARQAAVVAEELGRAVAPVPFLGSAVIASQTAITAGDGPLLEDLAAGRATAALVVTASASEAGFAPLVHATQDGLVGGVEVVADIHAADVLLVPAVGRDGVELHRVDAGSQGVDVRRTSSLDMTRPVCDVRFSGASGEVVASGETADRAVREGLRLGEALLASEQVGVAQWCLDATVSYLTERRQFGRVLAGYQALKHRLSDVYMMVESGRAAASYAAATAAAGSDDQALAAAVAQAYCSDMAVRVAEEALQLHAGIGMTWEHPLHLRLKRAKASQLSLGRPEQHLSRLAELVGLPPS